MFTLEMWVLESRPSLFGLCALELFVVVQLSCIIAMMIALAIYLCLLVSFSRSVGSCHYTEYTKWASTRLAQLQTNGTNQCNILSGGNASEAETVNNSSVKLFVFQQDELELISDWLQYHAYLFGINNLYVIDNDSREVRTCKLLALYQTCGVTIITHSEPFSAKQTTLTDTMLAADKNAFLIPLDADEFIILPERPAHRAILDHSFISSDIRAAFDHLPVDGRKYKFQHVYAVRYDNDTCEAALTLNHTRRAVVPGVVTSPQYRAHNTKTFFHAQGFIATDQGNHFGKVENDNGRYNADPWVVAHMERYYVMSGLSLMHLQISTHYAMQQKMLRAADAYGFNDTSHCGGNGEHYCKMARIFRSNEERSRKIFWRECFNRYSIGVPIDSFNEWFVKHALSLDELVGE